MRNSFENAIELIIIVALDMELIMFHQNNRKIHYMYTATSSGKQLNDVPNICKIKESIFKFKLRIKYLHKYTYLNCAQSRLSSI